MDQTMIKNVMALLFFIISLSIGWGTLKAENDEQSEDINSLSKKQAVTEGVLHMHTTEIAVMSSILVDNTDAVDDLSKQAQNNTIILERIAGKLGVSTIINDR